MTVSTTSQHDDKAMQALSNAGAQCGVCGDQPGDRDCPDCERCYREYVKALRAAGWAPRSETYREAADEVAAERDATDVNVAAYDRYDFRQRVALGLAETRLRRAANRMDAATTTA